MLDEAEPTGGKINWPIAIAISVAAHAVLLFLFWLFSGSNAADQPAEAPDAAAVSAAEPPPVTDPSGPAVGPSEPVSPPVRQATPPVPAVTVPPTPPVSSVTPPVSSRTEGGTAEYVVKPGDGPIAIARRCKCTTADLERLNSAAVLKRLHPGQVLKVPAQK